MKKTVLLIICMIPFSYAMAQTGAGTATLKNASRLFGEKDDLTSVIMIIPSGSKVNVLGSDSTYYLVKFDENEGYIFKRQAEIDNNPTTVPASQDNNQQPETGRAVAGEAQPQQNEGQSRFSYLEEKYGTSTAVRINSGKIWKGMTAEMVKDSWGSPGRISRIVNGNAMKEEWTFKSTILYFENSVLINWGPARKQ